MSWVSKSNESKRSPVCPSAGRMVNSRRRSEAMMKRVMIAAVVALGLSGCATMQGLTPCEKAILAKYAADKIIDSVCPLASQPWSVVQEEGISYKDPGRIHQGGGVSYPQK